MGVDSRYYQEFLEDLRGKNHKCYKTYPYTQLPPGGKRYPFSTIYLEPNNFPPGMQIDSSGDLQYEYNQQTDIKDRAAYSGSPEFAKIAAHLGGSIVPDQSALVYYDSRTHTAAGGSISNSALTTANASYKARILYLELAAATGSAITVDSSDGTPVVAFEHTGSTVSPLRQFLNELTTAANKVWRISATTSGASDKISTFVAYAYEA